jgi:uncharacterized membrane protein YcaP (DUF421 family)
LDIAIRAFVLFFFVFFITRIVGRRELSSLEPFDLILLMVISDAIQQGLTQSDYSVTGALIAVATIAILQVGVSYTRFRFPRLRPVLEGQPLVLVEAGKPIERNLKRERITLDEIMEGAREQAQIATLDEIQWAVLETSGNLSFISKNGS